LLYEGNGGTSSITLTSTGTPGIVTIIASSIDLESGLVNIPILGSAESISITATPGSIILGGTTVITVTITDSAGNPVAYGEDIAIELSLEPNNGILSGPDYKEGVLTFLFDESSKTITYTASDSNADDVNITASTLSGELSSDTVTIYIYEFLRIDLTANPEIITADEESSSIITATIRDINSDKVMGGNYDIIFKIVSGDGYLSDSFQTIMQTTQDGEANIELTPTTNPSLITVSARAENLISDSVTVQSTIPKFISISADKDWLYEGEGAVISIDVVDSGGYPVDYEGLINLTLSGSGSGSIDTNTLSYPGEDTAYFTALSTDTGEITITANGEGIISGFITIQILGVGDTILNWADNITVSSDEVYKIITFDIDIWGESLEIDQMKVNWDPQPLSLLGQISIDSNIVFDNATAYPQDGFIDIIDTPLLSGTHTIGLYFSGPMSGQTITVIFFDTYLTQYGPLEFIVP